MRTNSAFGIDNYKLKVLAIVCMLIDHIASIFHTQVGQWYNAMRYVGRLAFPIFCFLLVEGFAHTSNRLKYAIRLGIFCVISEPCFDLAFHQTWFYKEKQNVFFTLLIGFIAIWAMEMLKEKLSKNIGLKILKWILCVGIIGGACVLADALMTDYNYRGVLFIVVFYIFRDKAWISMILFAFVNFICGLRLDTLVMMIEFQSPWSQMWQVLKQFFTGFLTQDAAIVAILPMILYNGEKGRSMKWFFYVFYPAHLAILYCLHTILF